MLDIYIHRTSELIYSNTSELYIYVLYPDATVTPPLTMYAAFIIILFRQYSLLKNTHTSIDKRTGL
jgi:hypothetical protein